MAEVKKKTAHAAEETPVSEVVGEPERDFEGEINNLKRELEEVKKERDEAKNTISQYEVEYKKLSIKFNRLYGILGATIDGALNMDLDKQ